ncbi:MULTISPECIES: hypothetical protein [unclassified Streptomyces]|uniref:hypothetical protein n=1 Tax=unclassified Streptomyces TaxID=2593676 RepID=UPI0014887C17|nr:MULTISPECIES: hypothetical protein [unclassified Streptomyces]
MSLLRRIARRCETHDRASYAVTARLERQLGMEPSTPPDSFTDQLANPDLIDCGNAWCQRRR